MDVHASLAYKVANYKPHAGAIDLVQRTPILLLAGVAGAGKDSIKAELLKTGKYHRIISHTTRVPRINHGVREQHGVDYHFIELAEAEAMLDRHAFIEAKLYSGNVYGTSVDEIRLANRTGKIAVADIEVQGVAEYVAMDPQTRAVFVLPPDYQTWQLRLRNRHGGTADPEEIAARMRTALRELEHALETTHMTFVINQDLTTTAAAVDHLMHRGYPAAASEARRIAEGLYGALRTVHVG